MKGETAEKEGAFPIPRGKRAGGAFLYFI